MTAALNFLGIRGLIGLGVALILSVALGLQVHKTHHWQNEAALEKQAYQLEKGSFDTTVANYRSAAAQAHAADLQNVERVRQEQATINERTQNEYEARLADARARAGSLRSQLTAAAHSGSPAAAGVSGPNAAPGSAAGCSAEDGFSVSDRLVATEQAIQLDELIKWVKANVKVDLSGSSQQSAPTANR